VTQLAETAREDRAPRRPWPRQCGLADEWPARRLPDDGDWEEGATGDARSSVLTSARLPDGKKREATTDARCSVGREGSGRGY
jgi:hypothetical protein